MTFELLPVTSQDAFVDDNDEERANSVKGRSQQFGKNCRDVARSFTLEFKG